LFNRELDDELAARGRGPGVHLATSVEVIVDLRRTAGHTRQQESGEGRSL
jgi:hypothetical protein